jgi:hypothetical protein
MRQATPLPTPPTAPKPIYRTPRAIEISRGYVGPGAH